MMTSEAQLHIRTSGEDADGLNWIDAIDTGTTIFVNGAYKVND